MQQEDLKAQDLAEVIAKGWANWIIHVSRKPATGDIQPQKNVWAGQFSPCARELALRMIHGQTLEITPEQAARFRRGSDRGRDLVSDLKGVGREASPSFEVVEEERRFALTESGIVVITGKVDAMIKFTGRPPKPAEIKGWSPYIVDRIKSFYDLFENKWAAKGGYQLLCYLYGAGENDGFMVLDRSGLPLVLPVELEEHWDRVDEFLKLAHQAVVAVQSKTLPDYIDRPSVCKTCEMFGRFCTPPLLSGERTVGKFFDSPEDAILLDRLAELESASREYEQIRESLKETFRGVALGVCGNWLIEGKWGKSRTVWLNKAVENQYQFGDRKHKFTLKFTRIGMDKEEASL